MITYTRKVLDPAAANQHHAVLLQVVTDPGNVSRHLYAVRQANTGIFTKCGVRFLRSHSTYTSADTAFLRRAQIRRFTLQGVETSLQCWRFRFVHFVLTSFTDELVNCWHVSCHPLPQILQASYKPFFKPTDPGGS
ncbi:hypothetical protein D1872_272560 [compost metagenome]